MTLVCGGVLGPYLHPRGRRSVAKRLAKLGVTVLDGPDAKVTAVTRDAVRLATAASCRATVTIWTAGFGVPDLAARSGLSTDAVGRLLTDETLTSVDDERIVAAGDSAAPSDLPFRMSCQAAVPLGAHAADTVLSRIAGEQPAPLAMGFAGQCISLGRRAGIFQFAHSDDTAMRLLRRRPPWREAQGVRLLGHRQAAGRRGAQARFVQLRRVREDRQAPAAAAGQARRGTGRRRPGGLTGAGYEDLAVNDREGRGKGREMSDHATDPATEAFVAHRNLLFTVAYEMLGSAADAEDVLQETWLRWVKVDLGQVRDQRAYLVRITTRQALNRLRTMKRRREAYVGPWLPEPLLTAPDVAEDVELAESVSMALMLVLETLSPTERAVFVLREAFDVSYDEIAAAVDKSPAAVRQIAHRARQHVDARRPREVVSPSETRAALESFQRALETGDLQGLLDVLAPEVVLVSDGGGVKQAALRPIIGAEQGGPLHRSAASARPKARSPPNPPWSTATRRSSCAWTARSTASWRSGSRTPASPASTTSATRRSCPASNPRPRSPCDEQHHRSPTRGRQSFPRLPTTMWGPYRSAETPRARSPRRPTTPRHRHEGQRSTTREGSTTSSGQLPRKPQEEATKAITSKRKGQSSWEPNDCRVVKARA